MHWNILYDQNNSVHHSECNISNDNAMVQERHGTKQIGFGQTVAPREAMWPPIDMPCEIIGLKPSFSHQWNSTRDSKNKKF